MATLFETTVPPEWIDFNGHMRDAYYVLCVASANDAIMEALGLGPAYLRRTGATLYNLESHTRYLKEAMEGDRVSVDLRLLDADDKRLHLFAELRRGDGALMSLTEEVLMHITRNGDAPRGAPFPPDVAEKIAALLARDAARPLPEKRAGAMGLRR